MKQVLLMSLKKTHLAALGVAGVVALGAIVSATGAFGHHVGAADAPDSAASLSAVPSASAAASNRARSTTSDRPQPPSNCSAEELEGFCRSARTARQGGKLDEALSLALKAKECVPSSPKALLEIGQIKFLQKEDTQANEALAEATQSTSDAKLLSEIWYLRGLVAERQSEASDRYFPPSIATRAFATSMGYATNERAREKLERSERASQELCGTVMLSFHKASEEAYASVTFPGVLAKIGVEKGAGGWTMPDEGPTLGEFDDGAFLTEWMVAKDDEGFWAAPLQAVMRMSMRTGALEFGRGVEEDGIWHVRGYSQPVYVTTLEGQTMPSQWPGDAPVRIDAYYHAKARAMWVLRADLPGVWEEREHLPSATVKVDTKGVSVTGIGCNLHKTWSLTAPAGSKPTPAIEFDDALVEGGTAKGER